MLRADEILERLAKSEIKRLKKIDAECEDLLHGDHWLKLMRLRQEVMEKVADMSAQQAVDYMESKQVEMQALEKKVKKSKKTMKLIDKQIKARLDLDALQWWLSYMELRRQ